MYQGRVGPSKSCVSADPCFGRGCTPFMSGQSIVDCSSGSDQSSGSSRSVLTYLRTTSTGNSGEHDRSWPGSNARPEPAQQVVGRLSEILTTAGPSLFAADDLSPAVVREPRLPLPASPCRGRGYYRSRLPDLGWTSKPARSKSWSKVNAAPTPSSRMITKLVQSVKLHVVPLCLRKRDKAAR